MNLQNTLTQFPRAALVTQPTPLEALPRLSMQFAPHQFFVKRDDCTTSAMGGNKARQLEFYLGKALADGCDCVLGTGAVQSNYMRLLASAAAKLRLECYVQLESRVANFDADYQHSGNVLLNHLLGARVARYPHGEDEAGADAALMARAERLSADGKKPYVIPLGANHAPLGALGYVRAAHELTAQLRAQQMRIDLIAVGSGSGMTHAGLLVGLRLLGVTTPLLGVCVRRNAEQQHARVLSHCRRLATMLDADAVDADEVWVDDAALAPGYGRASQQVRDDVRMLARQCGLLTDPVYSGKTFSGALNLIRAGDAARFKNILVVHTGGVPALFAYRGRL